VTIGGRCIRNASLPRPQVTGDAKGPVDVPTEKRKAGRAIWKNLATSGHLAKIPLRKLVAMFFQSRRGGRPSSSMMNTCSCEQGRRGRLAHGRCRPTDPVAQMATFQAPVPSGPAQHCLACRPRIDQHLGINRGINPGGNLRLSRILPLGIHGLSADDGEVPAISTKSGLNPLHRKGFFLAR
jgi:hypothetical protein